MEEIFHDIGVSGFVFESLNSCQSKGTGKVAFRPDTFLLTIPDPSANPEHNSRIIIGKVPWAHKSESHKSRAQHPTESFYLTCRKVVHQTLLQDKTNWHLVSIHSLLFSSPSNGS